MHEREKVWLRIQALEEAYVNQSATAEIKERITNELEVLGIRLKTMNKEGVDL